MEARGIHFDIRKAEIMNQITEDYFSIANTLARRGFTFVSNKKNLSEKLLINIPLIDLGHVVDGERFSDKLYNLMNDEFIRKVLRKISELKNFKEEILYSIEWKPELINPLIERLTKYSVLKKDEKDGCLLENSKAEFGENLEWYISELIEREFNSVSDWGVHIEEAPDGGDYDVLGRLEDKIIYVECKGGKPSNLYEKDLISILKRDEFLRPYLTILLFDSTDTLNVVKELFNSLSLKVKALIIKLDKDVSIGELPYFTELEGESFCLMDRFFVINSKRDIKKEIMKCLRHRYRTGVEEQPIGGEFWFHKLLLKVQDELN